MSGAMSGLDELTPEEQQQIAAMQTDDGGPVASDELDLPIDLPAPEPEPGTADAEPAQGQRRRQTAQDRIKQLVEERNQERQRVGDLESKLREAEQARTADTTKLQTRLDAIVQALAVGAATPATAPAPGPAPTQPVADEPLPDLTTDPVGHLSSQISRLTKQYDAIAKRNESLEGMVRGFQEGQTQAQRVGQMRDWAQAQENEYAARVPDYRAAMDHLRAAFQSELEILGVPPAERETVMRANISQVAARAQQTGTSFPDALYKLARARGWQVPAAAPTPAATPQPAAPARQPNRENTTTIGSLGSAPPTQMTVDRVLSMDDGQFDAYLSRLREKGGQAAVEALLGS